MKNVIQNIIMTIGLFPLSMLLVWGYMKLFHEYDKRLYWWVVAFAYLVMLFVCWGVETGYLSKMTVR